MLAILYVRLHVFEPESTCLSQLAICALHHTPRKVSDFDEDSSSKSFIHSFNLESQIANGLESFKHTESLMRSSGCSSRSRPSNSLVTSCSFVSLAERPLAMNK
jgi:hypothetical protein